MTGRPPTSPPPSPRDDADPGLPGLRSWRAVYITVIVVFGVWVTLLIAFMRAFS